MALFSFADIKFTPTNRKDSARNNLTPNSQYRSKISRYPIDIGDTNKGHYMVIHINEQLKTQFKGSEASDDPTIISSRRDNRTPVPGSAQLAAGAARLTSGTPLESSFTQSQINLNFTRTIRRTTDSIALYMPDTLMFQQDQGYNQLGLGGLAQASVDAATGMVKSYKDGTFNKDLVNNLSPFVAQYLQESDFTKAGIAAYTGKVTNPMLDMIYSSPEFRNFRFDFMFYPRSQQEAKQVNAIIRKLKFYQAPEYDSNGQGYFLVPPSEFDIKFYYNGVENVNIPKISTCVLKSIDVDYAPNGWSAYETNDLYPEDGGSGMPVGIRMGLQFTETEVMTKNVLPNAAPEGSYTFGGASLDIGNVS
jgi:hypothetical protein